MIFSIDSLQQGLTHKPNETCNISLSLANRGHYSLYSSRSIRF